MSEEREFLNFDDDGDPEEWLSDELHELESYVQAVIDNLMSVRPGVCMTKLELRAITERMVNVTHVACLSFMNNCKTSEKS